MKKWMILLFTALMTLSLTAYGQDNGTAFDNIENNPTVQNDNIGILDKSDDIYPRYTGRDGIQGEEVSALLQNSHITYAYNDYPDMPERTRNGEHMSCLNRYYNRKFTLYGYDRNVKGDPKYAEPDSHTAIVIGEKETIIYDFYRKIIATIENDYSPLDSDWSFDSPFAHSTINYWFVSYKNFKPDEVPGIITNELTNIDDQTIAGKQCDGIRETKTYTQGNVKIITYEYQCWTDPETELTFRLEWHVGRYSLNEMGNWFEVKEIGINCVEPSDIDAKIAEILDGQEDKYTKMTFSEYMDLFI